MIDYELTIKLPIIVRHWDDETLVRTEPITIESEVIQDDTLQMIFRDIDQHLSKRFDRKETDNA